MPIKESLFAFGFCYFSFFLENNQFILLTIIVVFFLLFYNALINNCLITLYYIQNYKKYINQIFKKKYIETFKKKEYKNILMIDSDCLHDGWEHD